MRRWDMRHKTIEEYFETISVWNEETGGHKPG